MTVHEQVLRYNTTNRPKLPREAKWDNGMGIRERFVLVIRVRKQYTRGDGWQNEAVVGAASCDRGGAFRFVS